MIRSAEAETQRDYELLMQSLKSAKRKIGGKPDWRSEPVIQDGAPTDYQQGRREDAADMRGTAAIDRLVHHATIFEMNVESYRRRAALDRKRAAGRQQVHATIEEKA